MFVLHSILNKIVFYSRALVLDRSALIFISGILAVVDGYMNIAMEQTEEYVNSQLKNKYGDAFIRGNNGMQVNFYKYGDVANFFLYNSIVH